MKFFILLLFTGCALGQTSFHQLENRKIFADHLYCSKDYLRAFEEYAVILNEKYSDTAEFKLALSLSSLGRYDEAINKFNSASGESVYKKFFLSEKLKNLLFLHHYDSVRSTYLTDMNVIYDSSSVKLKNISYLYSVLDSLPSPAYFPLPYTELEQKEVMSLYEMKRNLPVKNPGLAGFLSAVIPGAGKIYTEEYGDAALAFISTGLFTYLAYTNFKADHDFRGYLFSGIAFWFYGSNIYGSAASASLYNLKVNFSFETIMDGYLKAKNYFIPDYGFCR